MEEELRGAVQELIELEAQAKRFIKGAPEGKLRCAINKGCYQYYIGKEYQGKKKRNLVEKIAQKEYNLQLLGCIKKQINALENLLITLEKYILEHLGMMDKISYSENAMQKIDMYEKNGILLGDGLIITHETSGNPLDINVLGRYIERFL